MGHLLGADGDTFELLGVAAAAGLTGKTRAGPDTNQGMETSLGGGLTATLPAVDPRMDPESRAWVAALSGEGGDREAALARLHELLLRAARFELGRRRGQLARLSAAERHDLAVQAADDAMMSVLARLADFRGLSRFSTWAYKFALLEAATKARRLAWRDRELPRPPEDWAALADPGGRPEAAAEHAELLAALRAAVAEVLTPHQREVLLTVVAGRVPLDVLAERRGTTRGALYKTIHDARRKLRAHLAESGLLAGEAGPAVSAAGAHEAGGRKEERQ
jgi:RNA polymerase sigma-70 factor (ECF subfamily)